MRPILLATVVLTWPTRAWTHVKWFESFDVSTKPVPIADTLSLPAFWLAIAVVVVLLIAAGSPSSRALVSG
jgi:hypothetical protein